MGEDDVAYVLEDIKKDPRVFVVVEEDREKFFGDPPTKLKNQRFFKPFEMFIRMYGLPAHNEMDPTMFVALTYKVYFLEPCSAMWDKKGCTCSSEAACCI